MIVDDPAIATACPACGAPLEGKYCANCGQRAGVRVLSVRELLREVVEDQFSVNATLPRTLRALFLQPGFLTAEYLRRRISIYVPPFRLYLVASVLFFIVASFRAPAVEIGTGASAELDAARHAVRDSLAAREQRGDSTEFGRFGINADVTSPTWADNAQIRLGNDRLNDAVRARLRTLQALPPEQAIQRVIAGVMASAPKVMFLLLPLYAFFLKLLYIRQRRYYVEHFIFSLHIHAFTFGLFTVIVLAARWPVITGALLFWMMLYTWLALKRVYGQGWFRTTMKWLVLGQLYMVAVSLGLVLALLLAVLSI